MHSSRMRTVRCSGRILGGGGVGGVCAGRVSTGGGGGGGRGLPRGLVADGN